MTNTKNKTYLLLSILLSSILMCVVDSIIKPVYLVKSIIKVCLFLLVPLVYFLFNKTNFKELKEIFHIKKKEFIISLGLGILVFSFILGGYFLLKDVIDFSGITDNLTKDSGITKDNFLYVALYISFINSLLEEFFFRGYAFLNLKTVISKKYAYIISALLFSIYHVGMTSEMFNPVLFILSIIGLFIGGLIFNFLNDKCGNIYCSWIVHAFANFGINTIGLILFGII